MVAQLLRLTAPPRPADAADGVAVALTHLLLGRRPRALARAGAARMIGGVSGTLDRRRRRCRRRSRPTGGVGYEVTVPLGVLERLPGAGRRGAPAHRTGGARGRLVAGTGSTRRGERLVFRRLLGASGFGPRLALAMLSTLGPDRTVRAILDNDLAALCQRERHREEEGRAAGAGARGTGSRTCALDRRARRRRAAGRGGGQRADRAGLRAGRRGGGGARRARRRAPPTIPSLIVRRALQRLAAGKGGSAA